MHRAPARAAAGLIPEDSAIPFPSTGIHALLAWEDPAEVQRIYSAWRGPPGPPEFLGSLDAYRAELANIRRRGFVELPTSIPVPELVLSTSAAVVFDSHARPLLALALAHPTSAHRPTHRYFGGALRSTADTVTEAILGRTPESYA